MTTIYTNTLNTDADGQNGYTFVQRFEVAGLTIPAKRLVRARALFTAGAAQGLTVSNPCVGHAAAAGDPYDFASTPVAMAFLGNATQQIAAGQTFWSDWCNFIYNKTSPLLIAYYIGSGTSWDTIRLKSGVSNVTNYYKLANDAATVDKTGYTAQAGYLITIAEIQVIEFVPRIINII